MKSIGQEFCRLELWVLGKKTREGALLIALYYRVCPVNITDHRDINLDHLVKVESARVSTVKLLLFSFHVLFIGSQPTLKGRIIKLYPLERASIYMIYLFWYGLINIYYFILSVIIQC